MKYKICLHGLEIKNKNQLPALLQKNLPLVTSKSKIKEKYLDGDDLLKYKLTKLTPLHTENYKVFCYSGVMVISDTLLPLNDIVFEYKEEALPEVQKLVQKLLGSKLKFVLAEPDLLVRARQLRGRANMEDMAHYDGDEVRTTLLCHLPWHVYATSKAWGDLLLRTDEKTLVRQLRVKLRRLRSTLSFYKVLLPEASYEQHKDLFKRWANLLGDTREYDVALLTCMKIRHSQRLQVADVEEEKISALEQILQECRAKASKKMFGNVKINAVTKQLADFLFLLNTVQLPEDFAELRLKPFLRQRLTEWCDKLVLLPEKYPDLQDMEQLHKIRIKLKRFRYALQGTPEIASSTALLRSMKSLQDMLGFLHDDYVNDKMIEEILRRNADNEELRYECAMFCGWERAKAEETLLLLHDLWDNFAILLEDWREENL